MSGTFAEEAGRREPGSTPGSRLRVFFTGAGVPVCLLTMAAVYEVFLLAVMFAPPGMGPWSRFSEEFKVWCFSYNPATGGMRWSAVWVMLLEPPILALTAVFFYWKSLVENGFLGAFRRHWRAALWSGLFAALALFGLTGFSKLMAAPEKALPFPGERIRTQIEPPAFRLTDQRGREVSLGDLRGRVVLLTGVYATCSTACPQILLTLKRIQDAVPEADRKNFVTLALSLDPENDASWMMEAVAANYGFPEGSFHYLNGEVGVMRQILERFGFSAIPNPQTGAIDHANLFILIDAGGRIAYRFGLDPQQEQWIHEAVAQLLKETRASTPTNSLHQP